MLHEVTEISKLVLNEGEVLAIRMDIGGLSGPDWDDRARKVRDFFCTLLLTKNVIVYPGSMSLSIVSNSSMKEMQ